MKNKHPDRHLPKKKKQSKATESGRKTKQKRPEKKEKGQYTPPSKSEQSRRSVFVSNKTQSRQLASTTKTRFRGRRGEQTSAPEIKAGEERFRCEDNSTKEESTARLSTSERRPTKGTYYPRPRKWPTQGIHQPQKTEGIGRNSRPP